MTVSRALKDGTSIAAETRDRIIRAVEELGYVLDQSAGSLSSKRTGFVAALIPSINNSNFADTARGITDAFAKSACNCFWVTPGTRWKRKSSSLKPCCAGDPKESLLRGEGTHRADESFWSRRQSP